jgi:hypothetical protein
MPRTQLSRRLASLLGILALVGGALGPLAARAQAAPAAQAPDGQAPAGQLPPGIIVAIDEPTHRSGTATRVLVRGWAANPASERGTGVSRVDLYLDGGPDQGGFYLGQANYGRERPDVAAALGSERFLRSGWDLVVDLPRGPHTIVALAAPTGREPALVVPGVASVRVTAGGPAGRTAVGCAAGGYCTSDEGGEVTGTGPGWIGQPLYAGNQYVSYGAFGHGATTPPYGWWDALLPALVPYLLAYAAYAYPYPQLFFGQAPFLYNQGLLSTLSTQGVLGTVGGCVGPAFAGLDTLGLSVIGGYSYGFPFIGPLASTMNSLGTIGFPNALYGTLGYSAGPLLGVSFPGGVPIGGIYASGLTGGYNASLTTIAGLLGGNVSGPGGVGGAISTSYGGIYPGYFNSEIFHPTACVQRL